MNRRKDTHSAETDESSKRRKFIACVTLSWAKYDTNSFLMTT